MIRWSFDSDMAQSLPLSLQDQATGSVRFWRQDSVRDAARELLDAIDVLKGGLEGAPEQLRRLDAWLAQTPLESALDVERLLLQPKSAEVAAEVLGESLTRRLRALARIQVRVVLDTNGTVQMIVRAVDRIALQLDGPLTVHRQRKIPPVPILQQWTL